MRNLCILYCFILFLIMIFLPICYAEEIYENKEYTFNIEIPQNWKLLYPEDWEENMKLMLSENYSSEPLFIIIPSNNNLGRIIGFGRKINSSDASKAVILAKASAERMMTSDILAKEIIGDKTEQYIRIDESYVYNEDGDMALSKIVYRNKNNKDEYFATAWVKYFGTHKDINFRGYSYDSNYQQFFNMFDGVVNSYQKTISSSGLPENINFVWKWVGIILTVSIVLGTLKMVFFRD